MTRLISLQLAALMTSNYPPGVTGNEYAISGPDFEKEEERMCAKCERTTLHFIAGHHDIGVWAECEVCHIETDLTDEYEKAE